MFPRSIGPVAIGALALTAWLHARGISALVGAGLAVPQVSPPVLTTAATTEAAPRSADAIVERNPFDSTTGPLADHAPAPVHVEDACAGVRVLAIAAADAPAGSMALLRFGDEPDPELVGVGGSGGAGAGADTQVVAIDPGAVLLERGGARCVARIFRPAAPKAKASATAAPPRGVAATGSGGFAVDRATRDALIDGAADWMKSVSVRPEKVGGEVVGLRVVALQPGSPVDGLGIRAGDVLQSLNRIPLVEPEKMLQALGTLRTAEHLSVVVLRGGQPVQVDYDVR